MKSSKLIFVILLVLLSFDGVLQAQEDFKIQDPDKCFSKKEKQIFERAVNYESAFYNRIFPGKRIDFSDLKFTVVPDQITFGIYLNQIGGASRKNSPGVYFPGLRELVVCTDKKNKQNFIKISCHELSHAFLHLHSENKTIPAWLNEGLAVYLQEMTFDKKTIKQRANSHFISRVKTLIELKDLNLSDFVNWSYSKFSNESFSQEGYGYAICYCMVLFMMEKDEENAITIFRNSIGTQTSLEVFNNYYTGGFMQFEKDFVAYWSK